MWPFGSSGSSTGSASSSSADATGPRPTGLDVPQGLDVPMGLDVPQGADGIASDVPVIAYTEKVIAEKEASLRKYIQDNYLKLQAVEKELEALRLEVKLTSGSKKAAMELLRRKIEESTERLKVARAREQQAKQAWEASVKAVEHEEDEKQKLCDDLRTMIQESALQQYAKLESLTQKLDALNPELKGAALSAIEGLRAQIAPHGVPVLNGHQEQAAQKQAVPGAAAIKEATGAGSTNGASPPEAGAREAGAATPPDPSAAAAEPPAAPPAESAATAPPAEQGAAKPASSREEKGAVHLKGHHGRTRGGLVVPRGRGSGSGSAGRQAKGGWTGAGFDVDESS